MTLLDPVEGKVADAFLMANGNSGLNSAKRSKKDELYTQITDIERELMHYGPRFRGKGSIATATPPTSALSSSVSQGISISSFAMPALTSEKRSSAICK